MIWSLQVLRFVAALMVVYLHLVFNAHHTTGSVGSVPIEIAIVGTGGVDIFFVLSGVVIALTAPRFTAAQFAWRRIRRIMPIYFACSLPFLFAALWDGGLGWRKALATFLLWPATDVMTLPVLVVGWTLAFEMLFYAAAALVLIHRAWLYVLLVLYVLAFPLRSTGPVFQFVGNPMVLEFLFGVVIAYAPVWRFGALCVPIGASLMLAAGYLHLIPQGDIPEYLTGQDSMQRVAVLGIPAALIVYGTMHIKANESVWTYLGGASYTLYLVHPTVVAALVAGWFYLPPYSDIMIASGVILCVAFAWRVHELIEQPLLRLLPPNLPRRGGNATHTNERNAPTE